MEKNKKVRVVHCVSLFVLDDFGRLFLWRTESCETISAATAPPPSVSSSAHGSTLGSSALVSSGAHRSYEGPHAMNERILARAKAEAMRKPDEKLIDAILSSPTPQQRRPMLLASSSSTPNLGESDTSHSFDPFRGKQRDQLRNSRDWDDALQYLPSTSALSRGRRRTISAAHLISSQKKGCCGDYCHLQANNLATQRLESKKGIIDQPSVNADDPRRRSSVFTATAAANAFMESRGTEDPLKFQPRVGNQTSGYNSLKPSSPQKLQQEETVQSQFTIPFKLIAQTRAEKQLVDLFIRRYRNGEDGDYLAEEYYGDGEPLGQTFPGYYYQEVQVCENCFEFYMLVEKVRVKALSQITKKRAAKKRVPGDRERQSIGRSSSSQAIGRRGDPTTAFMAKLDERDETTDAEQDHLSEQSRHIWTPIWAHTDAVVSSITKKDAAELYSFVNPHPAIEMVLSSLCIMILGKEGAWTELKRAISQEKLLGLLQKFDLDHLSLDVVMKAAAHARNPLFSPTHIAPISSCAARFCDW